MFKLSFVPALVVSSATVFAQAKLPPPFATPSVANGPKVVAKPEEAKLQMPAGFSAEEYASGFKKARYMTQGPGGEVLVSDSVKDGKVWAITDAGKTRKPILEGLDRPSSLAIWRDYLYVAEPTSLKRYKYDSKALTAQTPGEEIVPMKDFGAGHWTRSIAFDRKGDAFYLGIGSHADLATGGPEMRAAVNKFSPDGKEHSIVATGIRNPTGLHLYPGSDALWVAVQERDFIGDDLVPDYFTHVQSGAFYGWPYAYTGPNEDPRTKGQRPDLVAKTVQGDVVLPAHAAVLDFAFYNGKMFPKEYHGGAFLAYHGSSNRSKRIGYSVAFVPFKNGKPAGPARDFLSGWMLGPDEKEVWGRPVGILQLADGSLLVSEDGNNRIWRVTYRR